MAQTLTGRAARLEDVAASGGVSLATASKALHNKPRISEETKQRVLDAAKQLNYSPTSLPNPGSRRYCAPSAWSPPICRVVSPHRFLSARENEVASPIDLSIVVARGDAALERQHVEKLLSLKVDGLLIVQCEDQPQTPRLAMTGACHCGHVYGPSTDPKDCSVTCDNVDAGRMAINHLISVAAGIIAIIGGDRNL